MGREAIVLSDWDWDAHNVPERTAIALAQAGWRLLYCPHPSSILRTGFEKRSVLAENIERFVPRQVGQRLNSFPLVGKAQTRFLTSQIEKQAHACGLGNPVMIYPHGQFFLEVSREFHRRGYFCVFLCMDYSPEAEWDALAQTADLVLAIPATMYEKLKGRFGEKVRRMPQFGPTSDVVESTRGTSEIVTKLKQIPRPRLAYLGPPAWRLQTEWVGQIFSAHPEWHFLACGSTPGVELPNCHDLGWTTPADLPEILRSIDIGFMPYDCAREFNRHCTPLKTFDYFAAGLPVVSVPLVNLREYERLIYFGDGVRQLEEQIGLALAEAGTDERREERRRIARAHSIGEMSRYLSTTLTEAIQASAKGVPTALHPVIRNLDTP